MESPSTSRKDLGNQAKINTNIKLKQGQEEALARNNSNYFKRNNSTVELQAEYLKQILKPTFTTKNIDRHNSVDVGVFETDGISPTRIQKDKTLAGIAQTSSDFLMDREVV